MTLLTQELVNTDDRGNPWSDNAIAKRCGVSHPFVGSLRSSLETVTSDEPYIINERGTRRTMEDLDLIEGDEGERRMEDPDTGESWPFSLHIDEQIAPRPPGIRLAKTIPAFVARQNHERL